MQVVKDFLIIVLIASIFNLMEKWGLMDAFLEALFVVLVAVGLLVVLIPIGILGMWVFYKPEKYDEWDN